MHTRIHNTSRQISLNELLLLGKPYPSVFTFPPNLPPLSRFVPPSYALAVITVFLHHTVIPTSLWRLAKNNLVETGLDTWYDSINIWSCRNVTAVTLKRIKVYPILWLHFNCCDQRSLVINLFIWSQCYEENYFSVFNIKYELHFDDALKINYVTL